MSWIKSTILEINVLSNTKLKQKQFGYLVLSILLFLFVTTYYKSNLVFHYKEVVLLSSIFVILFCVLVLPKSFRIFLFVWLLTGRLLGEITSFILLSIIYFLVLFPVVLFKKIFSKKEKTKAGWIAKSKFIDYKKLY